MYLRDKACLIMKILRSASEREFPAELASTFFYISENNGCTQEDLVSETGMSSGLVSRNVSWLGKRYRLGRDGLNLVKQERDPKDKERFRLFLTPKGERMKTLIKKNLP